MLVELLKSTADLRRVQKQLRRRVLKHKSETNTVQLERAGGYYKARYEGQADVAFGVNEQEAVQRLHKLPNVIRTVCFPKACDMAADRLEQRGRA